MKPVELFGDALHAQFLLGNHIVKATGIGI
jgi:hypothetical protein